jgi:hypothetical protein
MNETSAEDLIYPPVWQKAEDRGSKLTIHYYEAVLACLAIIVWHFYHVIFDPDVYPLNPACWDGHVSEEWQKHEHPLDSKSSSSSTPRRTKED